MIITVLAQAAGLLILAAAIYTVAGLHRDIFTDSGEQPAKRSEVAS